MASRYNLIVAGGGPAGSAAAIAAARGGLRVLLLERRSPPARKVCGEVLSAEGLGLWRALTGREPPVSAPAIGTAAFCTAGGSRAAVAIDPPAMGLSREALDGALLEAAAREGVEVRAPAALGGHEALASGGFRAFVRRGGGEEAVVTDHVVIATGRAVEAAGRGPRWIGRKGSVEAGEPGRRGAELEMFLLEGGGYTGVSPIETGRLNVCGLVREGGDAWLRHPALAGLAVEAELSVARFRLGLAAPPRADGALAVGDALAVWPPIVGDGITHALASGALVAEELLDARRRGAPLRAADWTAAWRSAFGRKLELALALHRLLGARAGRGALFALARALPWASRWLVGATRTGRSVRLEAGTGRISRR